MADEQPELINRVAELVGSMSQLAQALRIAVRTVQRWASGEHRVPVDVWPRIEGLVAEHAEAVADLRQRLLQARLAAERHRAALIAQRQAVDNGARRD